VAVGCALRTSWLVVVLAVSSGAIPALLVAATAGRDQVTPAASDPTSYKVEMHIEQDGERTVIRRWVDGSRSRMEIDNDGETYVVIQPGDAAGTTYTIVPSMKRVVKSTLPQEAMTPPTTSSAATTQTPDEGLELVGTETIDGRSVHKYRVKMPDGDGFIWSDASTELPVRMEAGGSRVEMRNYEFTRPAPELFQLPKGYEVMDLDQVAKSFTAARMVAGGLASGYAARAGESAGGNVGAGVGGALGGPIGAMVGQFIGKKIGKAVAQKAAGAVVN
jgi:hypothetical protein